MTEQERREHFAFLNGVAADMKESRKEIIDLLKEIKAEIRAMTRNEKRYYNDFARAQVIAFECCLEIINRHIKEYKE